MTSKDFEEEVKRIQSAFYKMGRQESEELRLQDIVAAHNAHIVSVLADLQDDVHQTIINTGNVDDGIDVIRDAIAQYGGKDEDTNSEET